jgi:butyryl-CoA dehydrogenase
MDMLLEEKHRAVRQSVRRFCDRELRPIASRIDQEARFPWDVVEKMGALGYFGIQVPKTLGGAGLDAVSYAIIIEEISRVSAAIGLCVTVHNSVAVYPIMAFGTGEQIERWVPAPGPGRKNRRLLPHRTQCRFRCRRHRSHRPGRWRHYRVNANKVFVTNGGIADVCLIFCRTDPAAGRRGISVVVAERGTAGFVVGDLEDLCGMRANPVCSIRLNDCRVPENQPAGP